MYDGRATIIIETCPLQFPYKLFAAVGTYVLKLRGRWKISYQSNDENRKVLNNFNRYNGEILYRVAHARKEFIIDRFKTH